MQEDNCCNLYISYFNYVICSWFWSHFQAIKCMIKIKNYFAKISNNQKLDTWWLLIFLFSSTETIHSKCTSIWANRFSTWVEGWATFCWKIILLRRNWTTLMSGCWRKTIHLTIQWYVRRRFKKGTFSLSLKKTLLHTKKESFCSIINMKWHWHLLKAKDRNKFRKKCTNSEAHDDCINRRLHELFMEKPGCTVPWFYNTSNICTDKTKMIQAFKIHW